MHENWLRCKISSGMFSDERVIEVSRPAGGELVALVPASEVSEQRSAVKVQVLERNGDKIARIPSPYPEFVAVADTDLTA